MNTCIPDLQRSHVPKMIAVSSAYYSGKFSESEEDCNAVLVSNIRKADIDDAILSSALASTILPAIVKNTTSQALGRCFKANKS